MLHKNCTPPTTQPLIPSTHRVLKNRAPKNCWLWNSYPYISHRSTHNTNYRFYSRSSGSATCYKAGDSNIFVLKGKKKQNQK